MEESPKISIKYESFKISEFINVKSSKIVYKELSIEDLEEDLPRNVAKDLYDFLKEYEK